MPFFLKGYIAMLVVVGKYRKQGIGKKLVDTYIQKVTEMGGDEVVLETEAVNKIAISFYTSTSKKNQHSLSILKINILFH